MSQLKLEPTGTNTPTTYIPVGRETEELKLKFTDIQGNGYAYVWVRSGKIVRRIDTIGLFDVSTYTTTVYHSFGVEDEIGINLIGYTIDNLFQANVTVEDTEVENPGGGDDSGLYAMLETRVTALENILENDVDNGGNLGPISERLGILETNTNNMRSDISSIKTALTSNANRIEAVKTDLETRIANISTGGTGGDGTSNIINTITLSGVSNPLTLDADLYDRVDIIGDRSSVINIQDVNNATGAEKVLIIAPRTAVAGTTRTYPGVDVWLTASGAAPVADSRPGFGELIYITNIHGAVFGQVKTGVQYKYHTLKPNLLSNYPFVENGGAVARSYNVEGLLGKTASLIGSPTWRNRGGVILGAGKYFVDSAAISTIRTIQIWFTLGALVSSGVQRVFTITEGGTGHFRSFLLEESGGKWRFEHRSTAGANSVDLNGTPTPGVLYCASVMVTAGASPSAEILISDLTNNTENHTIPGTFSAFEDRRVAESELRVGAGGGVGTGISSFLMPNSFVQGVVTYTSRLSLADVRANAKKYL